MATMLTAAELAEHSRETHPQTSMSKNCIVVLLRSGIIPCIQAGSRRFYAMEKFEEYLERGDAQPLAGGEYGKIRRIE